MMFKYHASLLTDVVVSAKYGIVFKTVGSQSLYLYFAFSVFLA